MLAAALSPAPAAAQAGESGEPVPEASPTVAAARPAADLSADELDLLGNYAAEGGGEAGAASLALRPSFDALAQRSVVQPIARSQSAKLPVTGPIVAPVDRERDARAAYDPTGVALGSFVVNASTTATVGATRNRQSGNEAYVSTITEVRGRSDWEANSVDFTLRGGLKKSIAGLSERTPEGDAVVNGRFDVTDVDRLSGSLSWSLRDDDDYDDSSINTYSARIGYDRSAGLIGLRTSLGADRSAYTTHGERDNTVVSGSLRLSLDSGAVIQPFMEGGLFARLYDGICAGCDDRNGIGGELKGGLAFATDTIEGELALGYAYEAIRDPGLSDLKGVIVEGRAAWQATPLTTVAAQLSSAFNATSLLGAAGDIMRSGEVTVTYALTPNAFVYTGGKLAFEDFVGAGRRVRTATLRAGVGYKLNPSVEVGLAGSHKIVDSTESGGDYRESTVEAFLTVKR